MVLLDREHHEQLLILVYNEFVQFYINLDYVDNSYVIVLWNKNKLFAFAINLLCDKIYFEIIFIYTNFLLSFERSFKDQLCIYIFIYVLKV